MRKIVIEVPESCIDCNHRDRHTDCRLYPKGILKLIHDEDEVVMMKPCKQCLKATVK